MMPGLRRQKIGCLQHFPQYFLTEPLKTGLKLACLG